MIWLLILILVALSVLIYQVADDTRLGRRAFDIRMTQLLDKLEAIEDRLAEIANNRDRNRPGL